MAFLSTVLAVADTAAPTNLIQVIQSTGIVGLLVIILYGGKQRWWVFGWQYRESDERIATLIVERDGWKELALRSANLAESMQELARTKGAP